ncbi:MAG: integrase, partial [Alphaproteobacteria bacterium]|nr:integrase [Alphaproteobacteria bacterium]
MKRYVRNAKAPLSSADEIARCFERYVRPAIGARPLHAVRRSEIADMPDRIDDAAGPVMADRVLAHLRKCFNWRAARDDDFNSPIVKGMARTKPKELARDRKLG